MEYEVYEKENSLWDMNWSYILIISEQWKYEKPSPQKPAVNKL